jgi:hypothetical protein
MMQWLEWGLRPWQTEKFWVVNLWDEARMASLSKIDVNALMCKEMLWCGLPKKRGEEKKCQFSSAHQRNEVDLLYEVSIDVDVSQWRVKSLS